MVLAPVTVLLAEPATFLHVANIIQLSGAVVFLLLLDSLEKSLGEIEEEEEGTSVDSEGRRADRCRCGERSWPSASYLAIAVEVEGLTKDGRLDRDVHDARFLRMC